MVADPIDEGFEPPAPLGEGEGAQVFVAFGEDVVDAQMSRVLRQEF